jgi:hypothetical protein
MLSVSQSQLQALAESTVDAFLDRVATRVQRDFRDELGSMPFKTLRHQVELAFDRLRPQRFQRKEYLHRLIVLELLFGPQFEAQLPPDVRLQAFPPPTGDCLDESIRFWAIYRAAEHLTCSPEK